jgi:hypothetical protein
VKIQVGGNGNNNNVTSFPLWLCHRVLCTTTRMPHAIAKSDFA